jgi:hypothetical protein
MRFLLEHGIHLLALVAVGAWVGWARLAQWRQGHGARLPGSIEPPGTPNRWERLPVAAGSLGAAVVHASVIGEHFQESWVYGAFFVAATLAQLAWALAVLRRPAWPLLVVGAVGNGLVVVLWLVTRTVGLPVGPEPGVPEPVGAPDVLATACELVVVLGSMVLATRLASSIRSRRPRVLR